MSNYPLGIDVFVNKTGVDNIASSDPNNAFDGIEAVQGLIGALGEPQTWSTTLMTLIRRYKRGMYIDLTAGALTVKSGEAVLENTNGNKFAFRRNAADVSIVSSQIDIGSLVATTYYIYATAGGVATTTPLMFSTDPLAPSGIGTAPYRRIGWFENASIGALSVSYAGEYDAEMSGKILQICNFQTGAVAVGSTALPFDDTVPQITEGDQYMTLAITPVSATSKLKIDVVVFLDHSTSASKTAALFQGATANALAVGYSGMSAPSEITFTHYMIAGTTSIITFRVRAGAAVGATTTFNGSNGGRVYGGVMVSSITITEIAS